MSYNSISYCIVPATQARRHAAAVGREACATLAPFSGRFIVRGGNLTVLEGEWPHPRLVVIEFPSRAVAEGWYGSSEYRKVISLRLNSSVGNLIIVDGSP